MSRFIKYFACYLLGFFLTFNINGQEISDTLNVYEDLMNQYELACKKCIDMKNLVNSGFSISKQEASNILNQFISLNKKIKSQQDSLPAHCNVRFKRINQWFASGIRPSALDDKLSIPYIDGNTLTNNRIFFHYSPTDRCIPRKMSRKEIRYFQRRLRYNKTYILLNCSAPLSYGLRIGFTHKKFGLYASGRSNFSECNYSYTCLSDGSINNGLMFWSSGLARRTNLSCCAGFMAKGSKWLDIYGGVGYGYRNIFWQDVEHKWAKVRDLCHRGFAAELGIVLSWNNLSFSAGFSTIKFQTVSTDFGIGINF